MAIDHYDGLSGALLVSFPRACGEDCSTPGQPADESVRYWLTDTRVVWHADNDTLRKSLRECGAWEDLEEADTQTLRSRALWIAACDWREEQR